MTKENIEHNVLLIVNYSYIIHKCCISYNVHGTSKVIFFVIKYLSGFYHLILTACDQIDLTFALDTSGSITQSGWYQMTNITESLLSLFNNISSDCVRYSLLSFGTNGYLHSYLNEHYSSAERHDVLYAMRWRDQSTNTGDAIRRMIDDVYVGDNGDRENVADVAVIITDGPSNRDRESTVPNAQVQSNKADVYTSIIV